MKVISNGLVFGLGYLLGRPDGRRSSPSFANR
jgi:hypothetical protein